MGRHRVLIVGCGFGGLFAARVCETLTLTRSHGSPEPSPVSAAAVPDGDRLR